MASRYTTVRGARFPKEKPRYRICLGGNRCVYAKTLEEAASHADFWIKYGAAKVIIAERLPSGRYSDLEIVTRRR